jgi:hypothetical protein
MPFRLSPLPRNNPARTSKLTAEVTGEIRHQFTQCHACGDPANPAEFAALAEASGWDAIFVEDYIERTYPTSAALGWRLPLYASP